MFLSNIDGVISNTMVNYDNSTLINEWDLTGQVRREWRSFQNASEFESIRHRLPYYVSWVGMSEIKENFNLYWPSKWANFFALEIVISGNGYFTQDNKEYILKPGTIFLLHKNVERSFGTRIHEKLNKRYIRIDGALLDSLLCWTHLDKIDILTLKNPNRLISLFKKASQIIAIHNEGYMQQLCMTAFEILMCIVSEINYYQIPDPVIKAIDLISKSMNTSLSFGQLCKHAALSPSRLNNLFNTYMGTSPMHYYAQQKMELARQLLSDNTLSVKEISCKLKFKSLAHFSKQFKNNFDVSPSEFREQFQKKPIY